MRGALAKALLAMLSVVPAVGAGEDVAALAKQLGSDDWYTRWHAAVKLAKLGPKNTAAVPALTEAAAGRADIRREALIALAASDTEKAAEVLARFAGTRHRRLVLVLLGRMRPTSAALRVALTELDREEPVARAAAERILARAAATLPTGFLAAITRPELDVSRDALVTRAARDFAQFVRRVETRDGRWALQLDLEQPDARVQRLLALFTTDDGRQAAALIGRFRHADVERTLVSVALFGSLPRRLLAVELLGYVDGRNGRRILKMLAASADEPEDLRARAARSLKRLATARAAR